MQPGYLWLVIGSFCWIAAIVSAPAAHAFNQYHVEFFARAFFSPICHQDPSRTLTVFSSLLPVCERCSAIYFSFAAVITAGIFSPRLRSLPFSTGRTALFVLPLVIDFVLNLLGLLNNTSATRVVTGSIGGVGLALAVIPAWLQSFSDFQTQLSLTFLHKENAP